MTLALWLSFITATLLIDLSPGPSVMLVISVTIGQSLKEGIKTVCGLQFASFIWFAVAVAALLSSYEVSGKLLNVIAVLGAAYLIYMGLREFVSLPDIFSFLDFRKKFADKVSRGSKPPAFVAGLMTQLANPKSYLYWLAFLPQFQPTKGPTIEHNLWLLLLATISTMSILSGYAYAAHKARQFFLVEKRRRFLDHLSGVVLLLLGTFMLAHHFNLV